MPRPIIKVAPQPPIYPQVGSAAQVSGAFLNSPALTGIPTAPTAAADTNTTQLATTAFVIAELVALLGGEINFSNLVGSIANGQVPSAAVTQFQAMLAIAWSQITGTPTTVAGYAISDVYTKSASDALYLPKVGGIIQPAAAGNIGLVIKGAASQTADLLQAQDSTGAVRANITSDGRIIVGQGTGLRALQSQKGKIGVAIGTADTDSEVVFRVKSDKRTTNSPYEFGSFAIILGEGGATSTGVITLRGYSGDNSWFADLLTLAPGGANGSSIVIPRSLRLTPDQPIMCAVPQGYTINIAQVYGASLLTRFGSWYNGATAYGAQYIIDSPTARNDWVLNSGGTIMSLTGAGKLGLNGVTAPSQVIDIGAGKIVADGSLLTNLPTPSLHSFVAVPTGSTAAGTVGQWSEDATWFYVCVATNTWKRIAWDTGVW